MLLLLLLVALQKQPWDEEINDIILLHSKESCMGNKWMCLNGVNAETTCSPFHGCNEVLQIHLLIVVCIGYLAKNHVKIWWYLCYNKEINYLSSGSNTTLLKYYVMRNR